MKKYFICAVLASCFLTAMVMPVFAQEEQPAYAAPEQATPAATVQEDKDHVLIMPDLPYIMIGFYEIGFDIRLNDSIALYLAPTYFNLKLIPFLGSFLMDENDLSIWSFKFRAGVTWYPEKMFEGFFVRGYACGNLFNTTISSDTLLITSVGAGLVAGVRSDKGRVSWATYGGVEFLKGFVMTDSQYSSISDLPSSSKFLYRALGMEGVKPTVTSTISIAL